jgi:hypothetical protein
VNLRDALTRLCRYPRVIRTAPHELSLVADDGACWLRCQYPPALLPVPQVSVAALFAAVIALALCSRHAPETAPP